MSPGVSPCHLIIAVATTSALSPSLVFSVSVSVSTRATFPYCRDLMAGERDRSVDE